MNRAKALFVGRLNRKVISIALMLLLILFLVPVIRLTEYAVPWYDDYNYALTGYRYWQEMHSFAGVLKGAWYTVRTSWYSWQGTFSSIFFMALMPGIWGESQYFWGPLFLVIILVAGCFAIMGVLAKDILKADRFDTLLLQAVAAIIAVALIHTAQAGIYWYNAGVHYIGMHSFFFLLTAGAEHLMYVKSKVGAGLLVLWSIVGAVIVGGSNYVTALQGLLVMATMAFIGILFKRKRTWAMLPSLAVYAVSFYLNVSAPGNSVRQAQLAGVGLGMDALSAILYSFGAAVEYSFRFSGFIMVAIMVTLIPLLWNMAGRNRFSFALPGVVSLYSFCLFAAGFTPSFYSMGHAGLGRTLNVVKLTWQILVVINEMYWIGWIRRKVGKKAKELSLYWWFFLLMGVLMAFVMFNSSNIAGSYSFYGAYYYVHSGEAYNFYQEYQGRIRTIQEGGEDVIVKPYYFKPWFLCVGDLSEDSSAEENRAMAEWYGKQSIVCKE